MGFDSLIIGLTTNIVKNVTRFETSVDDLIAKFEIQCPPKNDLLAFIKTKNRITGALTQIQNQFQTLDRTQTTLNGVVTALTTVTTIIKTLPAPTAIAGVGIPISVITTLSDTLDRLSDKIRSGKGSLDSIPEVLDLLEGFITQINSKLQTLDQNILGCLESELEGMTEDEKVDFFEEIGFQIQGDNINETISLEDQLQPGSDNPLYYKGFLLTIEYDSLNEFPFPRRRVRGKKRTQEVVGEYSYSFTTQILVDEVKFEIDNINKIFTRP